ncbi:TIGR04500 family putative peptide maturation system protein [Prescottella agglutinans]|uniref:TIGR04500 family putative peptide maturation system protein n=1 Tax=Prescottella agglutinans TaxID=1644129 RepID=UPI003D97B2D1
MTDRTHPDPPTSVVPATDMLPQALRMLIGLDGAADVESEIERQTVLDRLRADYPGVRMRLLRHRESVDDSVSFGLLITEPGIGTVSLSWAPLSTLPWSLRGTQRTAESMLLRVNGEPMSIEQAMGCLDVLWERTDLLTGLVDRCLVAQELAETPGALDAAALQDAMDAFRRARGLLDVESTRRWMRERSLTHEALEDLVAREAEIAQLRRRVTADRMGEWLRDNISALARARVGVARFSDRADADWFAEQVSGAVGRSSSERISAFARAAATTFSSSCGSTGIDYREIRRDEFSAELADAMFAADTGDVFGPVQIEGEWTVIQVLRVCPATPGPETTRRAQEAIFAEWLAHRRAAARVEWFWGDAAKTAAAVPS